jgi:glyoxylase-like metal-dependent hydrolase (beta-lactamase superfamily II)
MIHAVVTELHLPAGLAGPDAMDFDVRCFLIPHATGLTLVDTGVEHTVELIAAELAALGADWGDVTDVILTHHHPDHIGGLAEVVRRSPGAIVRAGAGDTYPVEIAPAADGDEIRGLRVVAEPGHTAGHLGLLATADDALLLGDLAGNEAGRLTRAPAVFTADAAEAERSLHRVATLDFTHLYPSHGDPTDRQTLRDLVRTPDPRQG